MKSILILLLIASAPAWASSNQCFDGAAKRVGVDRDLLVAIARVESKMNPRARNDNSNGSYDIGLMQINSTHLPLLKKAGFKEADLLDPCTNIYIGAQILKGCLKVHGNTWRAVGAYNAGSRVTRENLRYVYAAKVKSEYQRLKSKNKIRGKG